MTSEAPSKIGILYSGDSLSLSYRKTGPEPRLSQVEQEGW